jgi:hypothetical protein
MKAIGRALRRFAKSLGNLGAGIFGSSGSPDVIVDDDDGEVIAPLEPSPEEDAARQAAREYDELLRTQIVARAIIAYAADAQVDGVRPAFVPVMPLWAKKWLPGLSMSDLALITDAGAEAVGRHIINGPFIAGLSRIGELPAVALAKPLPRDLQAELEAWRSEGVVDPGRVAALRIA